MILCINFYFIFRMRNYKKTTERGTKSVELMKRAADLVTNENKSLRQVSREYEISRTSLKRFMTRLKENPESPKFGYGTPRLVFDQIQETSLCEYLLTLAQIFHGIGPKVLVSCSPSLVAWLINAL